MSKFGQCLQLKVNATENFTAEDKLSLIWSYNLRQIVSPIVLADDGDISMCNSHFINIRWKKGNQNLSIGFSYTLHKSNGILWYLLQKDVSSNGR